MIGHPFKGQILKWTSMFMGNRDFWTVHWTEDPKGACVLCGKLRINQDPWCEMWYMVGNELPKHSGKILSCLETQVLEVHDE